MTKSAVRPRNWKAMREDRVLAMAHNRFGRMFASKDAAIAALAKLPAKEQRSLKKVAVSVAQKAAQSSAASTLAKGMSAAGKAAAKRVAPLALAGIVIAALNRPANAKDANMADKKSEKTVGDRLTDTALAGLAGAQAVAMFDSAREAGVGRIAKNLLRFGGVLSAAYAVTSAASALSSEAKAAAPIEPSDAPAPSNSTDGGVISTIGEGVKAAADFVTFGTASLALDAGSDTRKMIAEAKAKRDAETKSEQVTGTAIAAGGIAAQVAAFKYAGRYATGRLGLVGAMVVNAAGAVATIYGGARALDAGNNQPDGGMNMPPPPPSFGAPTVRPAAYLNNKAEAKASSASVSMPSRGPGSQVAAAPGNSDGMTAGYTRSNGVVVPSYRTPKR